MDQPCLKVKPRDIIDVRSLNNRKSVLGEDRNDRITHRSQVGIAATEVWVRLIHHHILALRLRLREGGCQVLLGIGGTTERPYSSFRHIV